MGVYDVAQRLHWDSQWAKAIGNPMAYDYGVLRQSWFYHHVADWAGDDAFIERMEDSIRKFNYQGDTQFLSGEVTGKREEGGRYLVDLQLQMVNQRDDGDRVRHRHGVVAVTGAWPAAAPSGPDRPAAQAATMFARHNELSAAKRARRESAERSEARQRER